MKTTKENSSAPAAGCERKVESPGPHQPDPFKDRQKLPPLSGLIEAGVWGLQPPANELEFANFYHL
jgi:hypothetical protein